MAKFIEITDTTGRRHHINTAHITDIIECGREKEYTQICCSCSFVETRTPCSEVLKMVNKKGGFSWL